MCHRHSHLAIQQEQAVSRVCSAQALFIVGIVKMPVTDHAGSDRLRRDSVFGSGGHTTEGMSLDPAWELLMPACVMCNDYKCCYSFDVCMRV